MFRFFETRINPYPKGEPTTPPRKLLPFLLHYSRPLLPWLLPLSSLLALLCCIGRSCVAVRCVVLWLRCVVLCCRRCR